MVISKKPRKDCLGCLCSEERFCQLGYDIKHQTLHSLGFTKPVPMEPCPKPLTGKDWLKARKEFNKYQTRMIGD